MRSKIRLAGILLALVAVGWWLFAGRNMGFTKTAIVQKRTDPVTGLEVNDMTPGFVPGVDFLGAGLAVAGALAIGSFFVRKQTGGQNKN